MTPRFASGFGAGTAGLLAAASLATGPLAAFLASPCALALVALARRIRADETPPVPRHWVGAGLAVVLLGGLLAAAGPLAPGLAVLAAGLGVMACGTQLALELDPPLRGRELPSTTDPGLAVGLVLDELALLAWEGERRVAGPSGAARLAADVRAAADRNQELGWLDHPERAHPLPPPLAGPRLAPRDVPGAGRCEHLRFESGFEPQDPEVREAYLAAARNRTAHAYLWRHPGETRPMLLMLHGYTMGHAVVDARLLEVGWLHGALGLDVALCVLPLHGPRARGALSGRGFLGGHPAWTNAAMGQAVWDVRRLAGWLRSEGVPALGLLGFSLGGYTAALLASLSDGFAAAVASRPASDLAAIDWNLHPPLRRAEWRAAGLTPELLDLAFARHSPLRVRPHVAHARRLIVGARADRIVPPSQVAALWEHWGQPASLWLPGTHLLSRDRNGLRRALAEHLEAHLGR